MYIKFHRPIRNAMIAAACSNDSSRRCASVESYRYGKRRDFSLHNCARNLYHRGEGEMPVMAIIPNSVTMIIMVGMQL